MSGVSLRPYQSVGVNGIRQSFGAGNKAVVYVLPTGGGKCVSAGTPVIMYDKTTKLVEDVKPGDLLMGPDGKPRLVVSTCSGREEMYKITPEKGDPYTVNESHIISLRNNEGRILNVSVRQLWFGDSVHFDKLLCSIKTNSHSGFMGWRVPGILRGDITPELTDISIEPVGEGDYYGFELSGPDRLFLLGDFTVTHNTFTFAYIANAASAKGNRVLILVHRKELLMQASMSLAKIGLRHTLVCQDKHFREIQLQHMRELKYSAIDQMANVCIASTGTLINRLTKVMTPQLIICDEAHHCIDGNTWGRIVAHFDDSRLLGVTATPIRVDGKGLGRHAGGMFDDMIIGPSMNELIDMGNLTPIRLFCPPTELDLSGVKRSNGDFQRKDIEDRVDKPKITGSAVEHYGKICPGAPTIAFCVSVQHAEHTAEQFRAGGFKFHSIDGSMHDAERRNLIHQLATGGIHGLTSCDIISEGTDIPVVTCGIMLRPTDSTGLYMQQGGRTLRPAPEVGKDAAIILDHVGNTMRHGLLNEDREWSLDGVKKKKNKNGENTFSVKTIQCGNCYAVFSPATHCPECGAAVEFRGRTVEEVEGSLKETTEAEIKAARKVRNYEDSQALTFNDLLELGKQRGYKNPAAWARFKVNGRKDNETRR